jgi:hypothetical protein
MDCDTRAAACARRADGAHRDSATTGGLTGAHHPTAAATSAAQAAAGISLQGEQRNRNEESNDEARGAAHAGPQHRYVDEPACYPDNHVQRRHQFYLRGPTIHQVLTS